MTTQNNSLTSVSRKTNPYNAIFVNKKYADLFTSGFDFCGYIGSDGFISSPEEVNYAINSTSKQSNPDIACVNVRKYDDDIVDFAILRTRTDTPSTKHELRGFKKVFSNEKYILTRTAVTMTGNIMFNLFDDDGHEPRMYTIYESGIITNLSARTTNNTHIYYDKGKEVAFIWDEKGSDFTGLYYPYHYKCEGFSIILSSDGKNIALVFDEDPYKRQAMFVIKSRELIKRFGKEFVTPDFLSELFIAGGYTYVKLFSRNQGELFEISYKKPNHLSITFYDGETISEDDGQINTVYVRKSTQN